MNRLARNVLLAIGLAVSVSLLLLVLPTSDVLAQSNSAPTVSRVSPSSPVSLALGASQTFHVRATDPDANMTKWEWGVDKHNSLLYGHSEPEQTFTATGTTTKSFSHTFPSEGTYTVTVTFTDSSGDSGEVEWRVEVENSAPSVRLSRSGTSYVHTGGSLSFRASASDADGNMTKWKWEVDKHLSLLHGHEEPEETFTATHFLRKSFSHTFPDNGTYTVKVTFTDEEGESSSASGRVEVFDPVTVQLASSAYEVDEDDGEVDITLRMSHGIPEEVAVRFLTFEHTADGGTDYIRERRVMRFPANTTTLTIPVQIINVNFVELDETFQVGLEALGNNPSYVTVSSARATVTIRDNDEATVEFQQGQINVRENSQRVFVGTEVVSASGHFTNCPSALPFAVNISYSDPKGGLASGAVVPPSLNFRQCDRVVGFHAAVGNVTGNTDIVFTLDSVSSGVGSRIKIGDTSSVTVTVIDRDHLFVTRDSPSSGTVTLNTGASQTFTARAMRPGNNTASYRWTVDGQEVDSGNLTFTNETMSSHTQPFPTKGTFTVNAEFTDSTGTTASTSWTVEVSDPGMTTNTAPTVRRVSPGSSSITLTTGSSRTFTARATDADSNITGYEWTLNGSGVGNSGTLTATGDVRRSHTHSFPSTGTHTMRAEFTDDDGATGSTSWRVVVAGSQPPPPPPTTENSAPTATIASPVSPVHMETGEQRTFTARASDDDDNLTKWKWDVDKHDSPFDSHHEPEQTFAGTGRILKSFGHTFPDDGTYTVTVTFTDSEGESDSEEWRVEVEDPLRVDDKSLTHTCGIDPATPSAGDEFTIVSEVTAGEDLDDVFVRFDFSDPARELYDRARGLEDPEGDAEDSTYDIEAGDTVMFSAPAVVSHRGDGLMLRCSVLREPGFLEEYIDTKPRQLAVEEKPITIGPYTQNRDESAIGYLKSCGRIATEGGELGAEIIRINKGMEVTVNAYLYKEGERVWEGSVHKDAVASTSNKRDFTLVFGGQPELEGEYELDCEMTVKAFNDEVSIRYLLSLPTCISNPFVFTLCAVFLAYDVSTQWALIDAESSTFCVGGYDDGCPFDFTPEEEITPTVVKVGEPVRLTFGMGGLNGAADHGGVSVSFPDLTDVGTGSSDYEYVSDRASVSTVSYTTGESNVAYHRPGETITTETGTDGLCRLPAGGERRRQLAGRRRPNADAGGDAVGAGHTERSVPLLAVPGRLRRLQAEAGVGRYGPAGLARGCRHDHGERRAGQGRAGGVPRGYGRSELGRRHELAEP